MKSTAKSTARPGPRFNQYVASRVALLVSGAAALGLFGWVILAPSIVEIREGAHPKSRVEHRVLAVLRELRAAWDPRERARVLAAAPEHAEPFAGTLDRILRVPDHPLRVEAVVYAGALGATELRGTLEMLVAKGDARVRAAAAHAAERLAPWEPERLAALLRGDDREVRLAALQICASRSDAPWDDVVELMGDEDEQVRAAALATLGEGAPPEALDAVWRTVEDGDAAAAAAALQALARTMVTAETEQRAAALLERGSPEVQLAALELLARRTGSEHAAAAVMSVVRDSSASAATRARALHGLERIAAFDAGEVAGQLYFLDPTGRYFAARCLITAGHAEGVPTLLELADGETREAAIASRQLLAWMTGRSPSSSRGEFENALERRDAPGRRQLPAPALDLEPAQPGR